MSHAHPQEHTQPHQFQDGVHKLGEGVGELKENFAGLAQDAAATARAGVKEMTNGVRRTVDAGRKSAAQAVEGISDRISENPLTSIGVALGVGVAMGFMLSRTRK